MFVLLLSTCSLGPIHIAFTVPLAMPVSADVLSVLIFHFAH